jgi:hypothetical protein
VVLPLLPRAAILKTEVGQFYALRVGQFYVLISIRDVQGAKQSREYPRGTERERSPEQPGPKGNARLADHKF